MRLAQRRDTGEKVAIKVIDKELCKGKEDMIETEVCTNTTTYICLVNRI